MDDWLKDPLIVYKESSLHYRHHKKLGEDACEQWKTFHFSVRLKLEGADHFCRLALGAASMSNDTGLALLAHRQTKWYLDAFFFELISAYDTLLQEMNILYNINLAIDDVKWNKIKNKLPIQVKNLIEEEWEKDWFKRLRWYRNTGTHHAYIPSGSLKGGYGDRTWDYDQHKVWLYYPVLDSQKTGTEDLTKACPDYLKKMLSHIHAVWNKMKENLE
ncbi:MAG: hypothetical protein JW856_05065 [Dehalococcoidales bacterium]|nr:hypothetical protein [Dehalococcoidales bacterium]